jgi:hypothetical protein
LQTVAELQFEQPVIKDAQVPQFEPFSA